MKEYWADAWTSNCVWLFQQEVPDVTEDDDGNEVGFVYWKTTRVFLTRAEALKYGGDNTHNFGYKDEDWRLFGVPCDGKMAEILGRHTDEFLPKDNHRKDCQCPDCGRTIRWEEE